MWDGMRWCSHLWKIQCKGRFCCKSAGYYGVNRDTERSALALGYVQCIGSRGCGWGGVGSGVSHVYNNKSPYAGWACSGLH